MCPNSVSCPLCYQSSFPNIDMLRISLIKAANGPISCPICSDVLLGLDKLTIHLFSHTNLLLAETTAPASLISMKIHQPVIVSTSALDENGTIPTIAIQDACVTPTKCDICGLTFRSADLLRMHNKLIHRIPDDVLATTTTDVRYQCHLCSKIFKMKGSLRVHLKVVHLLGLPPNTDNSKLNICQKIRNKFSPVSSATATIAAPTDEQQNDAVYSSHSNSPVTTDANKIIGNETPAKNGESAKIWECDICAKSFTTKYFLKKHKRLHTGEMPYTCSICGKTFTFQQSYHKHLLYHSDEKPHVCQTCGRAFKELSTLHNHERIHSGEKPFKCESCGKCFRQRVSYLVHKRIHTGAMPYKCTACEKSFRYKVSQRTHKCTAQPPGTVVRQGGDLLERLLHSTSILPLPVKSEEESSADVVESVSLQNEDSNLNRVETNDEELLIKSIDDLVSESCHKMGIGIAPEVEELFKVGGESGSQDRTPSPSEKFQSLCLYSPCGDSLVSHLETINEDSFKQLLYGNDIN